MSNYLNLPNNEVNPNFEAMSFTSQPQFHADWKKCLDPGLGFLCDRFWRLRGDETFKVVEGVGILMLSVTVDYPEFTGVNIVMADATLIENGVSYEASSISLLTNNYKLHLNPERTAQNLIEATNEQLLVLGSPYHLPIE